MSNVTRIEINRPVGRVLLRKIRTTPLPPTITRLESFSTPEIESYYLKLPAGVHCIFQVRRDNSGWRAIYSNNQDDVLEAADQLNNEIPAQTSILV